MRALGYSLTWTTHCFLVGGCGQEVYAHTNGYGDFVLFDRLGWPWPIHGCYLRRFGGDDSLRISHTRDISYDGVVDRDWQIITPVKANASGSQRKFRVLGTVTHVDRGFLTKSEEFRHLPGLGRDELDRVLRGRTSVITIVTGDGLEFVAFLDLNQCPVGFRDIIGVDVKAVQLLGTSVFVVNRIKVFRTGDRA